MCAILDANVIHEVFGINASEAGRQFWDWMNSHKGRLVVGGKLLRELKIASGEFLEWSRQAQFSGKLNIQNQERINAKMKDLHVTGRCQSDDAHIIALAQISGARLLFSNDRALQQDFKNKELINNPRGKVYSTLRGSDFTTSHKNLLSRRDLCVSKH